MNTWDEMWKELSTCEIQREPPYRLSMLSAELGTLAKIMARRYVSGNNIPIKETLAVVQMMLNLFALNEKITIEEVETLAAKEMQIMLSERR